MSCPPLAAKSGGPCPELLILTARRGEYAPLLKKIDFSQENCSDVDYYSYKNIRLLHLGIGEKALTDKIARLPADFFNVPLLLSGTAGSLSEEIDFRDIFIASEVINSNDGQLYRTESESTRAVEKLIPGSIQTGRLLSVNKPLFAREKRITAARKYVAAAVDMETAFILRELNKKTIDPHWAALRIISDSIDSDRAETLANQKEAAELLSDLLYRLVIP